MNLTLEQSSGIINILIGIVIGAIITAWMHSRRKPVLVVTVDEDPTEPGDTSRLLSLEGNGPNGSYHTRDLFFAASILTHRLVRESESFEDALETFCECVRDIDESIESEPEKWTEYEDQD